MVFTNSHKQFTTNNKCILTFQGLKLDVPSNHSFVLNPLVGILSKTLMTKESLQSPQHLCTFIVVFYTLTLVSQIPTHCCHNFPTTFMVSLSTTQIVFWASQPLLDLSTASCSLLVAHDNITTSPLQVISPRHLSFQLENAPSVYAHVITPSLMVLSTIE